ncbi:hypothetical protein PTT_15019 [Pyrenophora teres f. teres 0-1]|uniref:Uncharacterized protein n=1 Tax=Pyrenophora teres f. teres (strain 0-1) TaxID=861557 RepID=E3RZF2_PYRTT|nr:hypothetical protein PTT_15019 [Pyrenophora teres f. teres 0-1]
MATIGSTTTTALGCNSRKFNWADDDEDDFDFETWKASADTSAPTPEELGSLQLSDSSDTSSDEDDNDEEEQEVETAGTMSHSCLSILFYDLPTQLAEGRYQALATAIGPRLEGKETCDLPAYPELNHRHHRERRYCYARQFQEERLFWCRDRATVYRASHLAIATHIDDAETIDEVGRMKVKTHKGEELNEWEVRQIELFEAEEEEEEMQVQSELKLVLDLQAESNENIFEGISKEDLEKMYRDWKKAQQAKQAVIDEAYEDNLDDDSVQSWEKSDDEEEEIVEPVPTDTHPRDTNKENEDIYSITRPMSRMGSVPIFTYADAKDDDDNELDFNDVIFGTEDEPIVEDAASCYSSGSSSSWVTDEGYASSSPAVHDFSPRNAAPKHASFMDIVDNRFSASSVRRKTQSRSDSMDALLVFRDTVQSEDIVEEAFDSDSDSESNPDPESDSESQEDEVEVATTSPARRPLAEKYDVALNTTTAGSSSSPPADEDKAAETQDTTSRIPQACRISSSPPLMDYI